MGSLNFGSAALHSVILFLDLSLESLHFSPPSNPRCNDSTMRSGNKIPLNPDLATLFSTVSCSALSTTTIELEKVQMNVWKEQATTQDNVQQLGDRNVCLSDSSEREERREIPKLNCQFGFAVPTKLAFLKTSEEEEVGKKALGMQFKVNTSINGHSLVLFSCKLLSFLDSLSEQKINTFHFASHKKADAKETFSRRHTLMRVYADLCP